MNGDRRETKNREPRDVKADEYATREMSESRSELSKGLEALMFDRCQPDLDVDVISSESVMM